MPESNKILFGMKEIMNVYRIGSEDKFYKLIKEGMPCKKIIGGWIASENKINKWFEEKTSLNS